METLNLTSRCLICHNNLNLDQENERVLTSLVIFHYHFVSWCKLQIYTDTAGGSSDFMWCIPGYQARKGLHTGTVKIDPHKIFHLK